MSTAVNGYKESYDFKLENVKINESFVIMLSAWHNYQKSKEQAKKMLYVPIRRLRK